MSIHGNNDEHAALIHHTVTDCEGNHNVSNDEGHNNVTNDEGNTDRGEDVEAGALQDQGEEAGFWSNLTARQILTLLMLCCTYISGAMYASLLAPFFPTEAALKGVSSSVVGLIFGVFPFILFISSPFFGRYMTTIGSKFMFVTGGLVSSCCAVLFGSLQWSPGGGVFIGLCFATRSIEAIATAASETAATAIAACTFPTKISTVMGLLEASACLGLVIGPPIGGLLANADDYFLPFAVTGGIFFITNIISIFILPSIHDDVNRNSSNKATNWKMIKIPAVLVVGNLIAVADASIGFLDVALAPYLNEIRKEASLPVLSPVYVGLIFLIPAALVAVGAPIVGALADKRPWLSRPCLIVGGAVGVVSFLFMAPSPLLSFLRPSIKLIIITMAIAASSWSGLILTYQEFVLEARKRGFPEGLATQGIVSGVYNSFASFGSFVGPTVGGIMLDHLGFPWSATVFAGLGAIAVVLLTLLTITQSCCYKPVTQELSTPSEREALLQS